MSNKRRDLLKAGAGVAAAAAFPMIWIKDAHAQWNSQPEKGAKLRVLRWSRFVQGDIDQYMANVKKFEAKYGIPVRVDNESWEDVRPKAAVAANVGSGPDIIIGTYEDAHQYPDKLVDVSDLATYLGGDTFWAKWTNLWTAEEDRHGAVLHDYMHDSRILDNPVLERMQFEYLKAGFEPSWDKDPYRVFVYTTLQERATQVSHSNTGKLAGKYEPTIGTVLSNVAKEEARHYTFYRTVFKEVLARDPNTALASAAEIMPSIDMPGVNMPHFREMADVIRRAGIYGPRDYLTIVQEQIKFWAVETLDGLDEIGKRAQEKILGIPKRLERVADAMESRNRAKTFSFPVAFAAEFEM